MNETLVREATRMLTRCGGVRPVPGGCIVPLVKRYIFPMQLAQGSSQSFQKEIDGDMDFELKGIQCDQAMSSIANVRVQIQLPSGRLLFGLNGIDLGQLAYVGAGAYLVDPPEFCPLGSKILVTLTDYGMGSSSISPTLCFRGAELLRVKGISGTYKSANNIPRIQDTINQNLLAPAWMAGAGIDLDVDEWYQYSTPGQPDQSYATLTIGGPVATTAQITIDEGYEFRCHKMIFDVTADAGATGGAVMGRVRTGSGDVKTDGFVDLARYLNGLCFGHPWLIQGGDSVYFDLALEDTAGAGNFYFQAHLEGYRRRVD